MDGYSIAPSLTTYTLYCTSSECLSHCVYVIGMFSFSIKQRHVFVAADCCEELRIYSSEFCIIILGMNFASFLKIINNSLFVEGFKVLLCAIEKKFSYLCTNWPKLEVDRCSHRLRCCLQGRGVVSVPHSQPEITVTVTTSEYRPRSTVNSLII